MAIQKAKACPKCHSWLTYETIGSYGDLYKVSERSGKPLKTKIKRVHYEHGDAMLYCPACGSNFQFILGEDATIYITGDID